MALTRLTTGRSRIGTERVHTRTKSTGIKADPPQFLICVSPFANYNPIKISLFGGHFGHYRPVFNELFGVCNWRRHWRRRRRRRRRRHHDEPGNPYKITRLGGFGGGGWISVEQIAWSGELQIMIHFADSALLHCPNDV